MKAMLFQRKHPVFSQQKLQKASRVFKSKIRGERGSASIEFVALALPLFIPIVIFLNHFAAASDARNIADDASRQAIRAYWASTNVLFAISNAQKTAEITARELGATERQISAMEYKFDCGQLICWGPDITMTLSIKIPDRDGRSSLIGSATETSSHWAVGS